MLSMMHPSQRLWTPCDNIKSIMFSFHLLQQLLLAENFAVVVFYSLILLQLAAVLLSQSGYFRIVPRESCVSKYPITFSLRSIKSKRIKYSRVKNYQCSFFIFDGRVPKVVTVGMYLSRLLQWQIHRCSSTDVTIFAKALRLLSYFCVCFLNIKGSRRDVIWNKANKGRFMLVYAQMSFLNKSLVS